MGCVDSDLALIFDLEDALEPGQNDWNRVKSPKMTDLELQNRACSPRVREPILPLFGG